MINYWWVTRPKRRLNSVPEVLATLVSISLDQEWQGQRNLHLTFEDALESANLKRKGERRDQTGGGARTYGAWLASLGLIFTHESTGKIKLTLAGEAILNGDSPVDVLKHQILKYQFPSSFSLRRGVNLASRFRIRPFRFLLRLLCDPQIESLSEEEIAKVVIVEADSESDDCYDAVVYKIMAFRNFGDMSLDDDFIVKYAPGKGSVNLERPYNHLIDTANTIVNWLEYTQLAKRDSVDQRIRVLEDKRDEVNTILSRNPPFIDRPEQQEYYQRKYGIDPKRKKDTRNLAETKTITAQILAEQKIRHAFIVESLKTPISRITSTLIDKIAFKTGYEEAIVEDTLLSFYPRGAIGSFMTEYFEMAFQGRDAATKFEIATVELFKTVLGFEARHIGTKGLTPDVLVLSDLDGYAGIIDNKAYSRYTINNDHKNRMIYSYIRGFDEYYRGDNKLSFFSYIAGGFGKNIDVQLQNIISETSVAGSAISVTNMIKLIEKHATEPYDHKRISDVFSVGRQVSLLDL